MDQFVLGVIVGIAIEALWSYLIIYKMVEVVHGQDTKVSK